MAIKYSELNKKVNLKPLSEEELEMIDAVEKYIDNEIIEQYKVRNEIRIFLGTAKFDWDPIKHVRTGIKPVRQVVMHKELKKRYEHSGWVVTIELDDMLDGPNMAGADYFVLKGRR